MISLFSALYRAFAASDVRGRVLTDGEIWDELAYSDFNVEPLTEAQVQPASIDLRLGNDFKRLKARTRTEAKMGYNAQPIDTKGDAVQPMEEFQADEVVLDPGDCLLGTTMETVSLPPDILGDCEGRSSVGRHFVEIHQTAGIIDPGYHGEITLEIVNNNPRPVKLYAGQRVCQMVVHKLDKPAVEPYGIKGDSKYQGQVGATASRLHDDQ